MRNVICEHCHEEVRVALYYYDARISTITLCDVETYEAAVKGKAICPRCGGKIVKTYTRTVTSHNIIDLALGRGD
jgi:hypothetical protein